MRNKKGFTLIELLAVIVILAIIALIATPIILGVIEKARKGSAESSALGYIDAVEKQIAIDMLSDEKVIDLTDEEITVGEDDTELKVKGTKPDSGSLKVNKTTGIIESGTLYITLGGKTYEVSYDGATGKATVNGSSSSDEETTEPEETLTGPTSENPDTTITKGLIKIVYLDPTDLTKECNASNSVSATGTKTGCMKWYAYAENDTSYTMILDHNTTALVAWNSNGTNAEINEAKTALTNDTSTWDQSLNARLITADEVAEITGADETLSWKSDKTYASTPVIGTSISYFYFDGEEGTDTTWRTKVATSQGASKYAWLYDNTYGCTSYGCNIADDNKYEYGTAGSTNYMYGYWTSTPVVGYSHDAWRVNRNGRLNDNHVGNDNYCIGVRPVITISKSIIS